MRIAALMITVLLGSPAGVCRAQGGDPYPGNGKRITEIELDAFEHQRGVITTHYGPDFLDPAYYLQSGNKVSTGQCAYATVLTETPDKPLTRTIGQKVVAEDARTCERAVMRGVVSGAW